ncbi:MAG: hypothetical protein J0H50_06210 [Xanthomonadales bacterium]|nr:hypothetical protein [Xanthomonadales bacterium]
MPSTTARIVVQATPQEKRALTTKARKLGMSVSELMRTGAAAFDPAPRYLVALAQAAQESIGRSMATVDATMVSVAKSNARIKAMDAKAASAHSKVRS